MCATAGCGALHRPHQGGHARAVRHRVDVRPVRQQRPHYVAAAGAGGQHERRQAAALRRVGVRAGREQGPGNVDARVLARPHQRRHAVVVRRVGVRAGAQQDLHGLDVVPVRCPEQRRHAVGARRVDVGAFVEQRPHPRPILARGGVDEAQVGGRVRKPRRPARERGRGQGRQLARRSRERCAWHHLRSWTATWSRRRKIRRSETCAGRAGAGAGDRQRSGLTSSTAPSTACTVPVRSHSSVLARNAAISGLRSSAASSAARIA